MASNEGKSSSCGSDSGLGSSAGGSVMAPHKHKPPHHAATHDVPVKKKAGSDSDGSSGPGDIASPELD
jgi:hypothetical protein